MKLSPGLRAIAEAAALDLSHDDIRAGLQDCLNDMGNGYASVCAVYGDSESGDVVYYQNGEHCRAPYELGTLNGKRTHNILTDQAINVLPRTVWDEEADEDDSVAGMSESERKKKYSERFPGSAELEHRPFAERFISKDERDAADSSDFAGTGKSFPILKPGDVMAAVRSIGRGVAGGQSAQSLKNKIKAIAKRKGWSKYLPKAWQDDGDKSESAATESGAMLIESAYFPDAIAHLKESETGTYVAKLIQPGRGSSGYYPEEVLKRDGPNIFKAGTHMYINHATDAEEAERPEGDLSKLASVLASDAYYDQSGKAGPGLYAQVKVFSDYANQIKEKAPYSGVSIRARGERDDKKIAPDGKPGVITALKTAQSVDHVTRAGAGGKLLTEAAADAGKGPNEMDKSEVQALIKESLAPLEAENKRLKEHLALTQAPNLIREALGGIRLPDAAKARILERLSPVAPVGSDGKIDAKKLGELVEAEAKIEAEFLAQLGYGDGIASFGVRMTEAEIEKQLKKDGKNFEEAYEEQMSNLCEIFVGPKIAKGGDDAARQARKAARNAFKEGRAA